MEIPVTHKLLRSAFFGLVSCVTAASAQMSVHAVVGMVKHVDANSISIAVDSDTTKRYMIEPSTHVSLEFPAELRASATDAGKFQKIGDYVLLYYYGFGSEPTAAAVKDLGPGPFAKVQGQVVSFDKHSHMLTLKDDAGKQVTLSMNDSVVVDKDTGVDSGKKFSPHKGDEVRVTYGTGATPTVAFLRETL